MIRVVEVGPRDGLQNEKIKLDIKKRIILIEKLVACGIQNIEIGALVSPEKVPQMEGSLEVVKAILQKYKKNKKLNFPVLVPNKRGMEDAVLENIKEISIFTAASEQFNQANINCSIDESFKRFEPVLSMAKKEKVKVRGYLSTAFVCPYEGKINPQKVVRITKKLLSMGCYEVSIGDTLGVATPSDISKLLKLFSPQMRKKKIAMHFHDTKGTALANTLESLRFGIHTFDSSIAGLGGCPYAPGAKGNLATESLVYMLNGMGFHTGINYEALVATGQWIAKELKKK